MLIRDWLLQFRRVVLGRSSRRMIRRPRRRTAATQVQALESRKLLTLSSIGAEFKVNDTIAANQNFFADVPKSIAIDRDGDFVVTWTSQNQDGSGEAVIVKRYDRNGVPLGVVPEIRANVYTTSNQRFSSVAVDADGDFVVTWSSLGQDGSGYGIYARRFDKGGNAISPEFRVNQLTTGNQTRSSVAMDSVGNFVVVWESDTNVDPLGVVTDAGAAVWAQFYRADGRAVGTQFKVNTLTAGNQRLANVALNDSGDFVVTWADNTNEASGAGYAVYAQRYFFNSAGAGSVTAVGGDFKVNQLTTGNQISASVAIDVDGDFVIVWQSPNQEAASSGNGIFARRYDSNGAPLSNEFQVNTFTTGEQRFGRIAMRNDGEFVVTWESVNQEAPAGFGYGIYGQRFNANGVPIGGEFSINTTTTTNQLFSTVGMSYDGDVVVAWTSLNQDGGGYGIYAQRYRETVDSAVPIMSNFVFHADELTNNELLLSPVDSLGAVFTENMFASGADSITLANATAASNWVLERFNTTTMAFENVFAENPFTVTFGVNPNTQKYQALLTFPSFLLAGNYRLTLRGNVRDATSPGPGVRTLQGGDQVVLFTVRSTHSVGAEAQVNQPGVGSANAQTNFFQNPQSVAMDSSGNYIVTWSSRNQDGSGYGVYARRYNRTGAAQGNAFLVNQTTSGDQAFSSVATFADGSFIITWTSGPPLSGSVRYRRYSAAGTATTAEITVGTGAYSAVATEPDGDYIITWSGPGADGSGYGVFAQQYNSANVAKILPGTVSTTTFRVNTTTVNNQRNSSISVDAIGGFIVTWSSVAQDGSGEGVYAQRFDQFGFPAGVEFRVNTTTLGDQKYASTAIDKNGDFVITWSSANQDGSGYGVYYQRYDRGANPIGPEMQANLFTTGNQWISRVSMDEDGDFVITWVSNGQDGDGDGIFARRFDNQGIAYGPEFQVSSFMTGDQTMPGVAMNRDGDFVVTWTSANQDGSSYGMYSQLYTFGNAPTAIALSNNVTFRNTNADTFVGTFTTTDPDAADTFVYSLVSGMGSTHNNLFYINGDGLFTVGPAPSFPAPGNYFIRVRSVDSGGQSVEMAFTINVPSDNTLPQIQLVNQVNFLPELTDVSNDVFVADIQITDDGIGTNDLTLSGADADKFVIVGLQLFLKAGTPLDFEVQKFYNVTVSVDDANLGGTPDDSDSMTIQITRLPQTAPTLGAFAGTVAYTETMAPVLVDADATVTDPDSANFNTGTLTVDIIANGDVNDRLSVRNQGQLSGQVSVNGNQIGYRFPAGGAPVVVATFVGGDGFNPLVITFNMAATREAVQAVLRNVIFSNVGTNPVTAPRTVRAVLTDGDGGTSNVVTKTITVRGINTKPDVTGFEPLVQYTANGAPVLVDDDAVVTDTDSPNLSGGTLVLQLVVNANASDRLSIRNEGNGPGQIGVSGNQIRFGNVLIGTFTGGSGATPLRIMFNVNSSPAAAQAVLRNVLFRSVSTTPPTAPRTVQVIMTDGDGGTSVARNKQITITRNNVAPFVNGFTATVNYAKGAAPVLVGGTATITDPDSPNFAGGTLTFSLIANGESTDRLTIRNQGMMAGQIGVSGSSVFFGGILIGTFTGGVGAANPLIVTFNANSTAAAATALIRNLQFSSVSANPSGLPRTLTALMTDGDGGSSNIASKTINVGLIRPVVTGFGGNLTYTENQAPIVIAVSGAVTDSDSPFFTGGNLTISVDVNASVDDRLTIFNTGNGANQIGVAGTNVLFSGTVIGTFTGGSGATPLIVTFNANASRNAVSALIKNLRFSNVSENPSTAQRRINLIVTDDDGASSAPVTKLITVNRVNDAPVIGNFTTPTVSFNRAGQVPVLIAPVATVTDADMVDFATGKLTFQLVNGNQAADTVGIRNQGFGAGQIGTGGNILFYEGVNIGTFSGGTGVSPLVITFNSNADQEAVQATLRNVTFRTATNATMTTRTIRVTLTDGDGGTTPAQSKAITIT